ncbi:YrdB family protein [Paenibacillus sacheonensis]|uniref:DUF2568 domain-containing protein n=1 Tax=Paenibacillus sacheonensis TaxID=742054 RepID=A0A7X5C180_9BACL|nr:YrdB family protein [Paenibacillus sacheonensis]MBM7568587.1 phosphoglycerol transferase MdoB-like AlkP superfamily enzyme [Paenibacillus sacheonensis]NBC72406.1 DUF2568 domain-containing protein [Paenibacillus sacheonensis]
MKSIGVNLLLALFFLLELAAMAAFGYWGYRLDAAAALKVIAAIAILLAVIVLWGLFLAPKATLPVFSYPVRTALKFVVFAAASAALYAAGRHAIGIGFLAASILIIGAVFGLDLHEAKP